MENKEAREYRELEQDDMDYLFTFYCKHNGNIEAMRRDDDCPMKGNDQLRYYKKKYHFEDKLRRFRRGIIEEYNHKSKELLLSAKVKAIQRAIELLEARDIDLVTKDGVVVSYTKMPIYKEIIAAWEIIKVELGEPTSIAKNENTNKNDLVDNNIEKLNKLLQDVEASVTNTSGSNSKDEPVSC